MKLPKISEWFQKRKLTVAVSVSFLEFFVISFFIGAINSLVGAYFFFTGLALVLFYYALKTS